MIKFRVLEYTFYSILPYLILRFSDLDGMLCNILWKVPNYILSIMIYAYYISQLHVYEPKDTINIINSRYKIVKKLTSKIETVILGLIYPMFGGLTPIISHIVNCIVIAEILYSHYDIRRRLYLYYSVQYNLLRILLYGIPLTILQHICYDTYILNYLYNTLIIIQIEWMMLYPSIHKLHIPIYHQKIMIQ